MSSYAAAPSGFASASRKGRSRTKPLEERVKIGVVRFKAALASKGGTINVSSEGDMVDFGVRHVFNRDRELGDNKRTVPGKGKLTEFRENIIAVVKRLLLRIKGKSICEWDQSRGQLILLEQTTPRRSHNQKYPPGFRKGRRIA